MILRTAILATSLIALAACDKPADAPVAAETTKAEDVVVAPTEAKLDTTLPGANSEYAHAELLELQRDDGTLIASTTKGAGLCTFSGESGRVLLTVGAPLQDDKPGAGVVRPNGKPAMALFAQAGGTDYILNGPTLERKAVDGGLAMTVAVTLADDKKSATMAVKLPDGERAPYVGAWSCEG